VRTGAALLVIVMGTWFFLMMQREPPQEVAMVLFGILTGLGVLYCLLSGVRSTADCLSEEKREGTLGLLFLTDLKGYDVVLGKFVANSVHTFYAVMAVAPMLAIPLLMGGLTFGDFGRMALVAMNALWFSLSLGICVSAMSRSARKAMGVTFLLLMLPTAILPAIGAWISLVERTRQVNPFFLLPSVGYTFFLAFDTPYKTGAEHFWWSLLLSHGAGWICLGVASLVAPRSWKDKPAGSRRVRWRERWQTWSYGNAAERQAFRTRLLNANAFFWLAARARLKPAFVWSVLGLLGCVWVWGLTKFQRDWLTEATYIITGILLNVVIKTWFASETGRQLAEDRKQGALELLLSTPLTVRDILQGQRLALYRQFLGPAVLVLVIACVLMMAAFSGTEADNDHTVWLLLWVGGMVMFVADLTAIYWVGMWQGLVARNPNRAASATLGRLMLVPTASYGVVMLIFTINSMRGGRDPSGVFFLGWWFGLGLVADVGFALWARQKLLSEFRLAAAQRYAPRRGFLKRLLGGDGAVSSGERIPPTDQ
jgi:ABC-type transport system involved in multi-copper enzyme maturation permease subunit